MDPQLTKDGKPYGPQRYEEIVRERYIISKTINTSYNDLGKITPTERKYIVTYIIEEAKLEQEKAKKLNKKK